MVFCRHCGIPMEDDQLYCIRCGTPSRPVDAPARPINEDKAPEQEPQAMPQTPPPQYQAPERPMYHQAPPPQMQNRPPYAYDPRMPMMEEERVGLKGGWLALSIINILLSVILFFVGGITLIAVAVLAMSIIGLVFTAIAANKPKRIARSRLIVSKIMNIISIVINGCFVLFFVIIVVAVLFMMILEAAYGVFDPSFIYEAESMLFKF